VHIYGHRGRGRGRVKKGDMEEEAHGIVIVGGGICGLATYLALHRCVHLFHITVFPSILPLQHRIKNEQIIKIYFMVYLMILI
jgi:hypothetical protein